MYEVFSIEFRGDHVHVQIGKDVTVDKEWQDEYWKRLRAACKEYDTSRVLVEGFSPPGERTTTEVVEAGQRTATVPNLWMAFCLKDFEPTEKSELYETVAASKGVRVKFFSDSAHALSWLRANAPR
jgi:hypothetical protein